MIGINCKTKVYKSYAKNKTHKSKLKKIIPKTYFKVQKCTYS